MVDRSRIPLTFHVTAGAFGAFVISYFYLGSPGLSFIVFSAAAVSLFILLAYGALPQKLISDGSGSGKIDAPLILVFCLQLGILLGLTSFRSLQNQCCSPKSLLPAAETVSLECLLLSDPAPFGEDRYRCKVKATAYFNGQGAGFSASGNVYVIIPSRYAEGNLPGRLTLSGTDCLASGLITGFHGKFIPSDKREPLSFLADDWSGTGSWISGIARLRGTLRSALMRRLLSRGPSGGFLLALLSGNRDYLEPGLAQAFRDAGLSHVLALSGMHLSIIGLLIIRFGKAFGRTRLSVRLSLAAMVFFVWFAGPSPSLLRAILMAFLLFWSKTLGFKTSSLAVLSLTALIQLLLFPGDAGSPAFILSYGALGGILAFSEPLGSFLPKVIPRGWRTAVTASIAAQIPTAGYTAAAFGTFVPFAFLAALPVGPLAAVYLSSGVLWLLMYLISPVIGIFLFPVMDAQYRLLSGMVYAFAKLPAIRIQDLSGILLAGIITIAAAAAILTADHYTRKGRLPDAGFTGL